MKLFQRSDREVFPEHINLLRAQFSDNQPVTHAFQQTFSWGTIANNLSLLDSAIQSMLLKGQYSQCSRILASIQPEQYQRAPVLFIYHAIALLFSNSSKEQLHGILKNAEESSHSQELQGEILVAQALIECYLGEQDRGEQLLHKSLTKIPQNGTFFRQIVERNLGLLNLIKGDLQSASTWYENLLLSSSKLQDENGILAAYNYLTTIRKIQGRFSEADVVYRKALSYIHENQLEDYPHSIKILAGYGHLMIQRHEIADAKIYLRKAIQMAQQTDIVLAQKAYQDLSEVFIREHDLRSALANIQECRQQIQKNQCKYIQLFNQLLLATEARIHLETGRVDRAYAWLKSSGLEDCLSNDLYLKFGIQLGYILPIAVRIYLQKDLVDQAEEILSAVIPKFLHTGANAYLIRALCSAALTYHRLGETQKAIRALVKAIQLAKPERNFGDFIFIGRGLMPLLYETLKSGMEPEFCGELLGIFSDFSNHQIHAQYPMNTIDPLSQRELDVLQLISKGMTNREIACKLYLSANTIKSHSIKIYRKLKVSNRAQAVSKARLLGILPQKYSSHSQTFV